jgi:hypothetical protein
MPEQLVRQIAARPALPVSPVTDNENIEDIVGRLGRRYTPEQISRAELTNRVRAFYKDFAAARIRNFVGIFVERLVRRSIETPPAKS